MIIGPGITITRGIYIDANAPASNGTPSLSVGLVFDLDAANFSSTPVTGNMDATNTYSLTVNNGSSTIGFSAQQTTGSLLFNGANQQNLTIPANSAFTLGTNNFTLEYYLNQSARGPFDSPFGYNTATKSFYWPIGTSQNFPYMSGTGTWSITGGTLPTLNTWNHYALVRNRNVISYYLNGVIVGSTTANFNLDAITSPFVIGAQANSSGTNIVTGNITNFRIVKGFAVYTSNFTPPTEPLTAISNAATSISGGSISFTTRGTSAAATYLTMTPITFGTNSWTIEAFVNFNDLGVQNIIGTSGTPGMMFYASGGTTAWIQNAFGQALSWSWNHAINTWYHIAATYDGTYVNVWVNGVQLASGRQTWASGSFANGNQIGSNSWSGSTAYGSNMLINNLRVVVGSTVYATSSTTITVPTAQLTAITNTQLLLQVNDAGSAYTDTSGITTVTNVRTTFSSTPYSYGGYNTVLLLNNTNQAELLTDSSPNNFTVNNNSAGVVYSTKNPFPGYFYKTANTVSDNIVTGPNTTSASYSVFMAYQPRRISSGGQGRILSTNAGQDWLAGTYAPAPGTGTMYQNVYYPGSTVWLSSDAADTNWHFIWTTYNYASGVANLYIAAPGVNNTVGPTAVYKTVSFAANSNRGFNQFIMWARAGGSEPGIANIGLVKTYNGALTVTDIQTLWSQYHTRFGI
jgi:hypothetical protein